MFFYSMQKPQEKGTFPTALGDNKRPLVCKVGFEAFPARAGFWRLPDDTRDLRADLSAGGEDGIRTHVGLLPNGFQDRLVMTASIPLRIYSVQFNRENQLIPHGGPRYGPVAVPEILPLAVRLPKFRPRPLACLRCFRHRRRSAHSPLR